MQQSNRKSIDFDSWASAVRQQMLDSLAKRRNTNPNNLNSPSKESPEAEREESFD